MFSEASDGTGGIDPVQLTLEDLIAVQPRHVRGRLQAGHRGPDGERPGRGRANSLDFDGLALYLPGDDVRTIDWRATNRTGQTVVRRFAAASHRAHMLVVDLRADLMFGTSGIVMAKTACLAAAWLAWKSLTLNEPVGLTVGDETIAPRRGRRHVLRLLDRLADAYSVTNKTEAHVDCEAAAALIGRKDELCIISDLPSDTDAFVVAGRALSRTRVLRYVLVEDPVLTEPLPPGRYPIRGSDGRRQVLRIGKAKPPDRGVENRLRDSGWMIERARDFLPRGNLR